MADNLGPIASASVSIDADLNTFRTSLVKIAPELEKQIRDVGNKAATAFSESFKRVGADLSNVGRSLSIALTGPLVAVGALAVKTGIDFESAFAGVRKTVDATEDQLKQLSSGFREMAKSIPTSAGELAKIGEAAGQLGIHQEDILGFTRVMADLGSATDLTADQAASSIAKIQNIFGQAGKDTDRLGSALVALGNDGASTESEIVSMAARIAGAGHQIGLTQAQVLAFASALSSVGIDAEAGGSAISRVFIEISNQIETSGKKLPLFAQVVGKTVKDFSDSFRKDAAGAMTEFIEKLGTLDQRGQSSLVVLNELGLADIRVRDALLRAAGAGDLLRNALELGTKAWQENTALTTEAAQRYQTTESQLKIFWQRVQDVGITLSAALLPALRSSLDALTPLITAAGSAAQAFAEMPGPLQTAVLGVAAMTAAAGPLLLILGSVTSSLGSAIPLLIRASTAITASGGVVPALSSLGLALAPLAGPAGVLALALAAVAAGILIFHQFHEATREVDDRLRAMEKTLNDTRSAAERFADIQAKVAKGQMVTTTEMQMAIAQARKEGKALEMQQIAQGIAAQSLNTDLKNVVVTLDSAGSSINRVVTGSAALSPELQKIRDAFNEQMHPAQALNDLMVQLHSIGVSYSDLLKVYSGQIVDVGTKQAELGQQLPSLIAAFFDEATAMEATKVSAKFLAEELKHLHDVPLPETMVDLSKEKLRITDLDVWTDAVAASDRAAAAIQATQEKSFERLNGLRRTDLDESIDILDKKIDAEEKALAKRQKLWDESMADIRRSAGAIFDNFAQKGESVFASLRNLLKGGALSLGRAIFEDITTTLFGPLLDAFRNFFETTVKSVIQGILGGIGKSIGNAVGGLLGLGGTAGAIGTKSIIGQVGTQEATVAGAGTTGATGLAAALGPSGSAGSIGILGLSGAATLGIGAAVVGAALLANHFIGQGRKTANKFTQGSQAEFDRNLGNVVDEFNNAKNNGTLTLDKAQSLRATLATVLSDITDSANEFAKGGKNEQKVVQQFFTQQDQIFGRNWSNLKAGFDTTITELQKTADAAKIADGIGAAGAAGGSGIPQTGLATSASRLFSDAVDRMVESFDRLAQVFSPENLQRIVFAIAPGFPAASVTGDLPSLAGGGTITGTGAIIAHRGELVGNLETLSSIAKQYAQGYTPSTGRADLFSALFFARGSGLEGAGSGPTTVNQTFNLSFEITGTNDLSPAAIRDQVLPEIVNTLQLGVRGFRGQFRNILLGGA